MKTSAFAVALVSSFALVSAACHGKPSAPSPAAPSPTQPGGTAAATLDSLALSASKVVGDATVTATVTLSAAAPAGGAVVSLSLSHGAATSPASITVPAGASSATADLKTLPQASTVTLTVTATYAALTRTADLTVEAASLGTLALSTPKIVGGGTLTGTVTLTGSASSAGAVIALGSSGSAATVPSSVTIAGSASSQAFAIATATQPTSRTVTISASFAGVTKAMELVVDPPDLQTVAGQTTDALTGGAVGDVTVNAGDLGTVSSTANGSFSLGFRFGGQYRVTTSRSGFVDRSTPVSLPGKSPLISLIPASFNLTAFNEMFRGWTEANGALTRWRDAPALIIETSLVRDALETTALGTQLSASEVDAMIERLTAALPVLTGGTFQSFRSVEKRTTPAGATMEVSRFNTIVIVHYQQQVPFVYCGKGGPGWDSNYIVRLGSAWIDREWLLCASDTAVHELGHALGYFHVTAAPSIMSSGAVYGLTDFDRQAGIIGFARQPGNRAPDIDGDERPVNALTAAGPGGIYRPVAVP